MKKKYRIEMHTTDLLWHRSNVMADNITQAIRYCIEQENKRGYHVWCLFIAGEFAS